MSDKESNQGLSKFRDKLKQIEDGAIQQAPVSPKYVPSVSKPAKGAGATKTADRKPKHLSMRLQQSVTEMANGVMKADRWTAEDFKARYREFMQHRWPTLRIPDRYELHPNAGSPTKAVNAYKDTDLVRYFLMQSLVKSGGADIVTAEFAYCNQICDILAVIKGRAVEFEIKTSRSDLANDFKKVMMNNGPKNKHGFISAGHTLISRFYFVVPFGMISADDLPVHVGVIFYSIVDDMPDFRVVRQAPMLHETAKYLSAGEWATIAKKLYVKSENLLDRYCNNKFKAILHASEDTTNNTSNAS